MSIPPSAQNTLMFIPGRSILDQVDLAKTMIDLCEITEQKGAILALDQEKAYDRIRHDYLLEVLSHFGLPSQFIQTIKSLYTTANTRIMVNGEISSPFRITRGVRQGDPISCLLFNLAIEPLAATIRNTPDLHGLSIPGREGEVRRVIISLFADDTTIYLAQQDSINLIQQTLDTWCLASGARFNNCKTVLIPVGPKTYRDHVAATRSIDGTPDNHIEDNIAIRRDGESTRLLGAHIGNNIDQLSVWTRQIEKITTSLNQWNHIHPTFQGRSHIIRMVVGGMTQYLTATQNMPKSVCETLTKQIRHFFWDGRTRGAIAEKYLFLPPTEGGWNLLDLKARNDAITLTKLKRLIDFSPSRPMWADAAFAIIIATIPPSERARGDEISMHTPFLQNIWCRERYGSSKLPPNLKMIMNASATYHTRFSAMAYPLAHKLTLPAWHHIGTLPGTRGSTNHPRAKCLRRNHMVHTTEDLLLHASQHEAESHRQGLRECECDGCSDATTQGCDNPDSCFRTARILLDKLKHTFDPRIATPSESALPERATTLLNNPEESWTLFDKSIETEGDISRNFRVCTESARIHQAFGPPEDPDEAELNPGIEHELIFAHTDGSCDKNGDAEAKAGSGIWFGDSDPRNRAIRVGANLPQTNNSGEMLAIQYAAQSVPPKATLCIVTDSKWAIQALTKNLTKNTDQGYVNVRNADLIQATTATLRARKGNTLLKWIKGHSGDRGNEGADRLAALGATEQESRHSQPTAPADMTLPGLKLVSSTQALLYKAIRNMKNDKPGNRAATNLDLTRQTIADHWGKKPLNANIWTSIFHNNTLSRNVRAFMWKCMYNAHACGPHWEHIPGHEQRAECSLCGEIESMDHILFRCARGTGQIIWQHIKSMCDQKRMEWPRDFDLYTILASPFADFKDQDGHKRPGANRFFQIVVSEAAFLIWKLRCKRKFDRNEDEPEKQTSEGEATNALAHVLNGRLNDDRTMMNRKRYGKKALTPTTVLCTWSGALRDETNLPADWIYGQSGVLVGMTPRRLNGRNR